MKKKILALMLALSCSAAIHADDRTMSLSIDVIDPAFGKLNLSFQYNLVDFLSLHVPVYYQYNWLFPIVQNTANRAAGVQEFEMNSAPINFGGGLGARFLLANMGMTDSF